MSDKHPDLPAGIYERILNAHDAAVLSDLPPNLRAQTEPYTTDDVILVSQYVQRELERRLASIPSAERQLELVDHVLRIIEQADARPTSSGYELTDRILRAIFHVDGGSDFARNRPDTPLTENAVFTAGMNQLALGPQLARETSSANEIYLLVSFIRQSGLDILWSSLQKFTDRGGVLHVLTTSYMGATQLSAIDRLMDLTNTDIRISFDTRSTRMHAKVYVFLRKSGASTAYIGSSNVTNPALTEGLEWNVKLSAIASPSVFETIRATCEAYRHDAQFELYDQSMRDRLAASLARQNTSSNRRSNDTVNMTPGEVVPYRYQAAILDRLQAERELHSSYKNLIVAATGTGKTVIAAFDYAQFRTEHPGARLLFVAHRHEILEQARRTFGEVLGDLSFGSLQVGQHRAKSLDHLFASIQSLNAMRLWNILPTDYYDYVVIDEFHHAAAPSYQTLLAHFKPQILLGLTATPERHDGTSIVDFFDGRIAAEIRLPQAIDEALLCPFRYFGLDDTVDLDDVRWTRGGYDISELENVYVLNTAIAERRATHILNEFLKRVGSIDDVHGLGFCVSVAHAEFMARYFNANGVTAAVVSGTTRDTDRRRLREALERGDITILFSVDVFNEGVDIPCVNTVVLLRPTESLTVFVQQLGRGLRLHPGKDGLLVLDFIGNANRNYRFEAKFAALLRVHSNVSTEVSNGFIHVPRGCYIELEEKPAQVVLDSITRGFNSQADLVERIQQYVEEQGSVPDIAQFLDYYDLEPQRVYKTSSFTELLRRAGYITGAPEPLSAELSHGGLLRLSSINSYRWLQRVNDCLGNLERLLIEPQTQDDDLMMRMLFTSIWPNDAIPPLGSDESRARWQLLLASPRLLNEMRTLLRYLASKTAIMNIPLDIGQPCPLDVHCTYTRNQLLAAAGLTVMRGKQAGVLWVNELNTDILLVTIHKTAEQFSESTMYHDYAIDGQLFHWQSQNSTAENSAVGQRYINHVRNGSHVLLFVRETKTDQYGPMPYHFLGPVAYVEHTGSKPMSIIWRLKYRMDPLYEAQISRIVV